MFCNVVDVCVMLQVLICVVFDVADVGFVCCVMLICVMFDVADVSLCVL